LNKIKKFLLIFFSLVSICSLSILVFKKKCEVKFTDYYIRYLLGEKFLFSNEKISFLIPKTWLFSWFDQNKKQFVIADQCKFISSVTFTNMNEKETKGIDTIFKGIDQEDFSNQREYSIISTNNGIKIFTLKNSRDKIISTFVPQKNLKITSNIDTLKEIEKIIIINQGTDIEIILNKLLEHYKVIH
jgi:hypothetical protein